MRRYAFLRNPVWQREVFLDGFGRGFWWFFAVAVLTGVICYVVKGPEVFRYALGHDAKLLLNVVPRVLIALSIAALIWVLLPRDRITGLVGTESGLAGLVIATLAGAVTPGGPSSAYALLAVLAGSGADRGAMIAYITSWGMLALQRTLVWDVPFMGLEFAVFRTLISLPLPIVAGLIARRLPFELRLRPDAYSPEGRG